MSCNNDIIGLRHLRFRTNFSYNETRISRPEARGQVLQTHEKFQRKTLKLTYILIRVACYNRMYCYMCIVLKYEKKLVYQTWKTI